MLAQLRPSYEAGLAQFRDSYAEAVETTTVVTQMDAGNVDPALVVITGADTTTPTIWLDRRADAGDWRHFLFAVEGCSGKTPTFQFNRATKSDTQTPAVDYLPVWTQDFVTWTSAAARTLVGGTTGHIEWQFSDPLPAGRVYVASHPLGRQSDAVALAADLLTNHASVASPTASADAAGVFSTSVSETDASGRQIGGHPMYAIKLAWGGSTTDGGPKRKLVQLAGIHAAGEAPSWLVFRACLDWMMFDVSQAAQDFRANWDVYLYFNLSPNGVYGGHRRLNSHTRTEDPNRDWDGTSVIAEIAATRTALLADVGTADAFFSWHCHPYATSEWIPGKNVQNDASPDAAHSAFIAKGNAIFGLTAMNYGSTTANTDAWWAQENLSTTIAFHAETGTLSGGTIAKYTSIGENWATTLQAVDADGLFYATVVLEGAAAAEPAASGDLATSIDMAGDASAVSAVSGDLTAPGASGSLDGAAQATAVAAADITTAIAIEGAATAVADASGALADPGEPAQLAGDATAQSLARATFYTPQVLAAARVRHRNTITATRPRNLN